MRSVVILMSVLLLSPLASGGKCPVSFLEVHGQAVGNLSPNMRISVALVFKNDRSHPQIQSVEMEDGDFAQSVEFFTLSRRGYFGGLFAEWGEKCSRAPEEVVVALVDQDGHEMDRVVLRVRRDFELDSKKGFVLRTPITLHAKS